MRVLRREPKATAEFIHRYGPVIAGAVRSLRIKWIRSPQMEDDLVQHVWMELFRDDGRRLRNWSPARGPFESYLWMVSKHRTYDSLRRAMPERVTDSGDLQQQQDDHVRVVVNPDADGIPQALDRYRRECSEADWRFLCQVTEGTAVEELAREFELSLANTYQRISRMRKRLKALME